MSEQVIFITKEILPIAGDRVEHLDQLTLPRLLVGAMVLNLERDSILLQKRNSNKAELPNTLDLSASGHVPAGLVFGQDQTNTSTCGLLLAIQKELAEETNINPQELTLNYGFAIPDVRSGKWISIMQIFISTDASGIYNHINKLNPAEFTSEIPDQPTYHNDEVAALYWVKIKDLLADLDKNPLRYTPTLITAIHEYLTLNFA